MIPKTSSTCPTHNCPFTNFCLSDSCIMPLCPACIGDHSIYHDKICTKSHMVMFQEAVNKIQQQKTQRTQQMKRKLMNMKNNLSIIKRHPDQIKATIFEAKKSALSSLQTLFSKLQTNLLKQHQKQSYKSVSQLTKLISSIEQFLCKFSSTDLQTSIELYKFNKQKDTLRKSQASIFQSQTDFSLSKIGINQFSYNSNSQLCLRQFVEKCLLKNKGKENQCFAYPEVGQKQSIIKIPQCTIFEIKQSASKYYGEPKTFNQNSYSFSERINKDSHLDNPNILDSSNIQMNKRKSGESDRERYQSLLPTGDLKFPTLDFTPGFSLMNRQP